jgi:hypothetical protein
VKGLPFNQYSWLTTHNSYALNGAKSATGSILVTEYNQEDSVTNQLKVSFSIIHLLGFCSFALKENLLTKHFDGFAFPIFKIKIIS